MKLTKANVPFTMVANEVLASASVSLKAKGLYAYLFSKPDGWDFAAERIQKECKEERKAILRTLKELEDAGYLERSKKPNGRVEYTLKYASEPKSRIGTVAKRHGGESVPVSKKDSDSNKEKESNISAAQGAAADPLLIEVNPIIELFEPLNPSFERLFKNTTQRAAVLRLLQKYGVEKVTNMVSSLPAIVVQKTAPRITTPLELETKLGQLVIFVKQNSPAGVAAGKKKEIIGLAH